METVTFSVPKISCGHCIKSIRLEVEEIEGVLFVSGDPESKEVTLSVSPPATLDKVKSAMMEIGFPPE